MDKRHARHHHQHQQRHGDQDPRLLQQQLYSSSQSPLSSSQSSLSLPASEQSSVTWSSVKAVLFGFRDSIIGVRTLFWRTRRPPAVASNAGRSPSAGKQQQRQDDIALNRIYKCCLLNGGVFGVSIILFEYLLIPTLQFLIALFLGSESGLTNTVWFWLRPLLSYTFGGLWILPLFCLSRVINIFWFQDVANSAFRGRIRSMNFPVLVADTLYSLVIQALFLLQATLVVLIPFPYLGSMISLVCMSILYALYSFEYKWFNTGWDTPRRLHFIENNWTYFFGFGLPLSLLTFASDSYIVNGVTFSVLFPFFIVSANEAKVARGLCDHPLPFFKLTIWLTNTLARSVFGR